MDKVLRTLRSLGLPFAYDHFAEGEAPEPPFICYLSPGSDNFFADNSVFVPVGRYRIELYTDHKDPTTEAKVEKALASFGWEKTEVYIDTERLYQIVYEIEV